MRSALFKIWVLALVVAAGTFSLRSEEKVLVRCPKVEAYVLSGELGAWSTGVAESQRADHGRVLLQEVVGNPELERYGIRAFLFNASTLGFTGNSVFIIGTGVATQFLSSDLDGDGSDELLCVSSAPTGFPYASLEVVSESGLTVGNSKYTDLHPGSLRLARKGDHVLLIGENPRGRVVFRRTLRVKHGVIGTSWR